jgi:glycine betaine catabolism A
MVPMASASAWVEDLLSRQTPGYTLSRELHLDPDVYRAELERIWRPAWLFAAHSAELLRAGDRTVFDVGDDSVLIIRGQDEQVRAFHNVCRHRGSRLVDICGAGADASFVRSGGQSGPFASLPPDPFVRCPYHQWAYRFDGSLAACGGMDNVEGFEVSEHGLVPVECAEVGGLIFVRLGPPGPPGADGQPSIQELAEPLGPQGLDQAKVAHVETYMVRAGWKVIWENNRECWHCHVGHPEYIKSHFDTANTSSAQVRERISARTAAMMAALGGLPAGEVYDSGGLATFPSPGRSWSAHRTPLVEGFATESLDGSPIAPLMGDYESFDVGVLRLRALPNFWCHASADHAVTTRLAPAGVEQTAIVVTWLVDDDAVEGRDYSLEELLPVWGRTSEQDWGLCERNQRGIRSSGYRPGPLSERHEANVVAFHAWYGETMGERLKP